MSARPDWVETEAAIAALLPKSRASTERTKLLASLADYSDAVIREARALGAIVPTEKACTDAIEWLLRPVFICGHHRSGTTLLQNLLDGHPQLISLPSEGTYFSSFAYVARRAAAKPHIERFASEWIKRFIDPNFEPHFRLGCSIADRNPSVDFARMLFGWHEALQGRVPQKFAALFALVGAYKAVTAPASTPNLWVEKTPRNELYVARFRALAGARFIQVVRDPRSTLASLSETYRIAGRGFFDIAEHARAIGESLRLARANLRRLASRYIVIRYEDLVDHPTREIERVRDFLGITPDAALHAPTVGGRTARANSSFGGSAPGVIRAMQRRAAVSAEQLALLGVYTSEQARLLGYSVPGPRPIVALMVRLRHWPHHMWRKLGNSFGLITH